MIILRQHKKIRLILWNNGKFNVRTRNEDDYQISEETLVFKNNNHSAER